MCTCIATELNIYGMSALCEPCAAEYAEWCADIAEQMDEEETYLSQAEEEAALAAALEAHAAEAEALAERNFWRSMPAEWLEEDTPRKPAGRITPEERKIA